MKHIAIAMAALLLAAGAASAELCGQCKGGMYIMSVGKCVECTGFAGSGAFKLCKACSAKLGQCEHCRAALKAAPAKPDKPKADKPKPAPKTQPAAGAKIEKVAIGRLIKSLGDADDSVRGAAVVALAAFGPKARPAVPALIKLMGKPGVRGRTIARTLARIGLEVSDLDAFLEAVAGKDEQTCEYYHAIAAATAGKGGVPKLIKALSGSRLTARRCAAQALGDLATDAIAAVPALSKAAADDSPELSRIALWALAATRSPQAAPALISSMAKERWPRTSGQGHRSRAAEGVARMGAEAVPALVKGLGHKHEMVRAGCVEALRLMGAPARPATAKLLSLLNSSETPRVQCNVIRALVTLEADPSDLRPRLAKLSKHKDHTLARRAGSALERLGPPPSAPTTQLAPLALDLGDHGKVLQAILGQQIGIGLEGDPATGFEWRLVKVEGQAVKWSGKTYVSIPPRQRPRYTRRAEGTYWFMLDAVKRGRATVTLEYAQPWEKDKRPAKTFKVAFDVHPDLTDERVRSLKGASNNFWLSLSYYGPGGKPHHSLRLRTPERSSKPGPNVLDVHISRAQAAKIIDHLAADGLLARVENSHDKPRLRPTGPTYVLTISSDKKVFEEGLGWNLATLQRLGALREALSDGAAEGADELLTGLAADPKQWEKILGPGYFMQEAAKVEKEIKIYIMQVRKGDNSGYGAWLKGRMGVMPFLVSDLLTSDEEQVRREGLRLAQDAYYGRPELATEIANLLDRMLDKRMDSQTDSRMSACRVLGQWSDQGSVPVLVKALGDPYERRSRVTDVDGSNMRHRYRAVWWEADAALRKITGASPIKKPATHVGPEKGQREACQVAWRKWWAENRERISPKQGTPSAK